MRAAAIRLSADERWPDGRSPIRRAASGAMVLLALASLVGHLLIVAAAILTSKPPAPPPQEVAVELVQEMPKPAEPKQVAAAKPAPEAAKMTPPPVPPKVQPPEVQPPKPDALKDKPAPAKLAEAPKTDQPKPPPPESAKSAPPAPKPDAADEKLAALQRELEALKAEQAALQAERAAAEAEPRPASLRDTGLGPLPDSFQAVALPAAAEGADEAVSYQAIVFSALAKAKGLGRTKGLPGSAGVHFSVDATGHLVEVELVHRSGVPSLDAEALDIVRRAAPFPPPPQGAQRSFVANVNFVTEGAQ